MTVGKIFSVNTKKGGKISEIFCRDAEDRKYDRQAVMLAIDGVYRNGRYIKEESDFMIPNDYVIKKKNMDKAIIFGASVHPYRDHHEMLAETRRCIDAGAAFFVWRPSIQKIDPEDERCISFYITLVKEDVPLLCYMDAGNRPGPSNENTEEYNSPKRLIKALDIGVSVIIANYPSYSGPVAVTREERALFKELIEMLRISPAKEWGLYADISPYFRQGMTDFSEQIENQVRLGEIDLKHLIYGCNFPAPEDNTNNLEKILPPRLLTANTGLESKIW